MRAAARCALALIGLIAPIYNPTVEIDNEGQCACVFVAEPIRIEYTGIDIDQICRAITHVKIVNNKIEFFIVRRNLRAELFFFVMTGEVGVRFHPFAAILNSDFIGGGLAFIQNLSPDQSGPPIGVNGANREVGSQWDFGRLFGESNLFGRRVGEQASGGRVQPRGLVRADQVEALKDGDADQKPGEDREDFGPVGDSFIRQFGPYYLFGMTIGAVCVAILLWLNRGDPNLPTVESDEERKKRDGSDA